MSDLSPEELARIIAGDPRYRLIDEALAVSADLRDSPALKYLMDRVKSDGDLAMDRLAGISPHDTVAVSRELVHVGILVYIRRAIEELRLRAQAAADSVQAEEAMNERDDGTY